MTRPAHGRSAGGAGGVEGGFLQRRIGAGERAPPLAPPAVVVRAGGGVGDCDRGILRAVSPTAAGGRVEGHAADHVPGDGVFSVVFPRRQPVCLRLGWGQEQQSGHLRSADQRRTRPAADIRSGRRYHAGLVPDGRWIAFLRRGAVYLISPLGGPERRLTGALGLARRWTPDSRFLVISDGDPERDPRLSLWAVSAETGERRRLTTPPVGQFDIAPAVSFDGRSVAFVRKIERAWGGGVWVVPLAGGEARRITLDDAELAASLAWMPDGRELLCEISTQAEVGRTRRLCRLRVPPSGRARLTRVSATGFGTGSPEVSRPAADGTVRLAYSQEELDYNLWRLGLPASGAPAGPLSLLIGSTKLEESPWFSPDGKRILFASTRSGPLELWTAANDGTSAV